jgi:hypothetical protein
MGIKLTALEAEFTKHFERPATPEEIALNPHLPPIRTGFQRVDTLAEADGIWFLCPKCFADNKGPVGTHMVCIGFAGRAPAGSYTQGSNGQDTRWNIAGGTGLDDLVLTPSVQLLGGCNWHGFVGSSGIPPGEAA